MWWESRTWVTGDIELSPDQEHALEVLRTALLSERPAVVALEGPVGVGKTVLADYFAHFNRDSFRGGVAAVGGHENIIDAANAALERGDPSLLIIEEAHAASELADQLRQLRDELPDVRIIAVSQQHIDLADADLGARIMLAALSPRDLRTLLGLEVTEAEAGALSAWLGDRVTTPRTVIEAMAAGVLSRDALAPNVELIEGAVILGPDGRPASDDQARATELDVKDAAERLFEAVSESPDLLRALDSREFEEVVAEYFRRQGYEVELTAPTRDGGKDVYVARTSELGSFLYIVECKAFDPTNPVGVRFVRHLYGVVQHERATAGVLATTSYFTKDAKEFQQDVSFQLSLRAFDDVRKWFAATN